MPDMRHTLQMNYWNRWMGQTWWRSWRFWAVVTTVALLSFWAWKKSSGAAPSAQVITAPVERVDLEDTVLASGTIEAAKQVSVGAQVSGQIKKLHVRLGDTVAQGQLIAEIDATNQSNTLRSTQAQVTSLMAQQGAKRAALRQAQLSFERQKQLLAQDATSRAEFENAEAALAATQAELSALSAQLAQSQIAVETARVNLGYARIVAPMAGVVVAVIAEEGRTVNANQSAPTIIKLANLDTVQIKAQISEADVVRVKPGLPVYFTILGEPNKRYDAKLRAVEPSPESEQTESTNTTSSNAAIYYNALFDVPNPDQKLKIAMTAQVFVVLNKAPQTLVIPSTALGERKKGKYVVRVQQGQGRDQKIVDREVTIGLNNRVQAQVLQGLQEGDAVVVGEAAADAKGSGGSSRMRPSMF
jgi:membrane fusion protein, macrolide-specific efflux system